MIKAGILSDTHLTHVTTDFLHAIQQCFADCEVIIHAGDTVDSGILEAFANKTVYAVHGNCCNFTTQSTLPADLEFTLGTFKIVLLHGNRFGRHGSNIEPDFLRHYPDADCLIYGHTHEPVCRWDKKRLIINPGSFQTSGRYGMPCTYAILEAGEELKGTLREFPLR